MLVCLEAIKITTTGKRYFKVCGNSNCGVLISKDTKHHELLQGCNEKNKVQVFTPDM